MYRILIAVLFLSASLHAQEIRLTAGESRTAALGAPMDSIVSVATEPPLAFPPVVRVEDGRLRVSTAPATRPGDYRLEVAGRTREGRSVTTSLRFTVDAVQIPRAASGRAPVILMNGFQLSCSGETDSTLATAGGTFGEMAALLQSDGASVTFFNNCAYGSDVPIEELAEELGAYISALRYTDGTPVTQVDLVTHSMGGLIARTYLAGLQETGVFTPLLDPKVHKLVQLATPNFGSFLTALLGDTETTEMTPGSEFLWNLATWNQNGDDLRGVDALAVVGNLGTHYAPGRDDGVVSVTSASLGFARPDARTRVVPYCHVPVAAVSLISFIVSCSGSGIAFIDDASHLSARIVRSFLADTQDWTALGKPPSQDAVLSQFGGMMLKVVQGGQATFEGVPLIYNNGVFYAEFLSGTGAIIGASGLGTAVCGPFTEPPGYYSVVRCNPGSPMVTSVGPAATGTAAKAVASGTSVTLTGTGFGQRCSTCSVMLEPGNTPVQISAWSDNSITVFLPPTVGLIQLFVQTASGSDIIGVFTDPPVLTSVLSSITNAASSAPGAIAPGEMITIKGTGLGPAIGVSFALNSSGGVDTALAGTSVLIGGFSAPITYTSATQVNAIVPDELAGALTALTLAQVSYLGNASASTALAVLDAQPAVFTFNSTGIGQAVAANQDGSFNGPSHPAPQGSYLTIYWTGGGVTIPAGVTGSVNGSVLKTLAHSVSVTVGGQSATVTFQGAAPGLIDGILQLNIRLDPATPSGPAQALIVTSDEASSPPTATVAIQ